MFSTSLNPKYQRIPPDAHIAAIYASAFNRRLWHDERVHIEDIYDAYTHPGKRPYKVAMVRQILTPNPLYYEVPIDCLRNITLQIEFEDIK